MKAAALAMLLAIPALAQDQVWRWVDEHGEEHYTNDKSTIPEKFRARAKATEGDELSVVKAHDGEPAAPKTPALTPLPATTPGQPNPAVQLRPTPAASSSRRLSREVSVLLFESSTNSASRTLSRAGVVDKLISNNPGLKLERVEFAQAVERAERLKVNQLPTVLFVDETQTVLARAIGLVTLKELQMQLEKARAAIQ